MNSAVEFELDKRLVKLAHRSFMSSFTGMTVRQFLFALVPFGVLGVIFLFLGGYFIYVGLALIAAGLGLGIYGASAAWRLYRKKMASTDELLGRMSRPLFRFQFTDDGVHSQTELSSGQRAWKGFQKLYRTPEVWLLFTDKTRYLVFPTASLSAELQHFIVQKCHEHKIPVA